MSVPFPQLSNDWLMVIFFFIVLLMPYLLGEKVAKVPVFGWVAKKFQERIHRAQKSHPITLSELKEFIEETVDERAGNLRIEAEVMADFIAYDAGWHRHFDIRAGELGWQPDDHLTFQEWMDANGREIPRL